MSRLLAALAVLGAAGLATALTGCSLDYEAARLDGEVAAQVPDTVVTGLVHRVVKNSRTALEVRAARAETWDAQRRTVLADAAFIEYDHAGKRAVEGRAGSVVFHGDTENAEIAGQVSVYSAVEEAGIKTRALAWKSKERLLTAEPDDLVVITKDDGSFLKGTGFVGDFRKREFTFSGPVQGQYVWTAPKEGE